MHLLLLLAALTGAQTATIDRAVETTVRTQHVPAVVIRIDQDGRNTYSHAWGLRNVPDAIPAKTDTIFQYGSITKQFTAAAIDQLIGEGKLSLSTKLATVLPAYAKWDITIGEMLGHTSGIPDYTASEAYFIDLEPIPYKNYRAAFASIENKPPLFPAGTKTSYNNAAYTLLARVVEHVSGMTFQQYLSRHFFTPLGMSSVRGYVPLQLIPNRASGYAYTNAPELRALLAPAGLPEEQLIEAPPWNMQQVDGAGFLIGDAADLQRWGNAWLAGRVLTGKARSVFFQRAKLANGSYSYASSGATTGAATAYFLYGGLAEVQVDGQTMFSAYGGTNGFSTFTGTVPSRHLTLTVLTNLGQNAPSSIVMTTLHALLKNP